MSTSALTSAGTTTRSSPFEPATADVRPSTAIGWACPMAWTRYDQKRAGSESPASTCSHATASGRPASHDASRVDLPAPAGALTRIRRACPSAPESRTSSSLDRRTSRPGGTGGRNLVAARPIPHTAVTITNFTESHPGETAGRVRPAHAARRDDRAMTQPSTHEIVIRGRVGARLLWPLLDDFTIDHPRDGV